MKPLMKWLDEDKFYIKASYDPATDTGGQIGPLIPLGVQPEIFEHCWTPDKNGEFPYTTYVYSAPKKSGKTTVEAMVVAWFAENAVPGTEIYLIANDREQVEYRVYGDVAFHFRMRNEDDLWVDRMGGPARIQKHIIELENGTKIFALAQEYKSAAGSRHALTAWDELWAYTTENAKEMWGEMTPVKTPGIPVRMRLVVTYAGRQNDESPLRSLYDQVVTEAKKGTNESGGPPAEVVPELAHIVDAKGQPVCFRKGRTFVYWDHERRMPWQQDDDDYLEEQRQTLRPHKYMQLHRNMWVTGTETFIPIGWWDRAAVLEKPLLYDPKSPFRTYPITIGVDVGIKHDTSAVVGVWHDARERLTGLAHHKIWVPTGTLDYNMQDEIVKHIVWLSKQFRSIRVVADPAHFYGGIVDLRNNGIPTEEFNQSGVQMLSASNHLYTLLQNQNFVCYEAPDIRSHVVNAVAVDKGRGFRIEKKSNTRNHVDAVIALAMAAYDSFENAGVDTSEPLVFEQPFSDLSAWEVEDKQKIMTESTLPPELRDFSTKQERDQIWAEWESEVD